MGHVKLAALLTSCVLVGGLFAQGLVTPVNRDDWEEINFEFNSSVLTDGFPSLLRLAELLKAHSDYRVAVTGYTDHIGSRRYNQKLAEARANAVRDFLVKYGANANQVTATGSGEEPPKVQGRNREARFMNRRVQLSATDAQGRVVSAGGVNEIIQMLTALSQEQKQYSADVLKRLERLEEIIANLKDLQAGNQQLRTELGEVRKEHNTLRDQVAALPRPLSAEQTTQIARSENERSAQEAITRNRKFSLLDIYSGPTAGRGRTGDFAVGGKGRFFSPFGGSGTQAVQAEAEYMYYTGRQEGQFDLGLVNRFGRAQAGLFTSFKYAQLSGTDARTRGPGGTIVDIFGESLFGPASNIPLNARGGALMGQAGLAFDFLFSGGKFGIFGTKGFLDQRSLNRLQAGPQSFNEFYLRIVDQAGAQGTFGIGGSAYMEANAAYLKNYIGADRIGAKLKLVAPITDRVAFTGAVELNESFIAPNHNAGRLVLGLQFGNWLRPRDYAAGNSPVPMDIPRVRYALGARRVGNSSPFADAGADQVVSAGPVTLNASGSNDPEGDALTYQWQQISGPPVALSGANTAQATFNAAAGQTYAFRLTVRDAGGLRSASRVTVTAR